MAITKGERVVCQNKKAELENDFVVIKAKEIKAKRNQTTQEEVVIEIKEETDKEGK